MDFAVDPNSFQQEGNRRDRPSKMKDSAEPAHDRALQNGRKTKGRPNKGTREAGPCPSKMKRKNGLPTKKEWKCTAGPFKEEWKRRACPSTRRGSATPARPPKGKGYASPAIYGPSRTNFGAVRCGKNLTQQGKQRSTANQQGKCTNGPLTGLQYVVKRRDCKCRP